MTSLAPDPFKARQRATFTAKVSKREEWVRLDITGAGNLKGLLVAEHAYANGVRSEHARHCYFFPELIVDPGDVVIVHSDEGKYRSDKNGEREMHHCYWGARKVWSDSAGIAAFYWSRLFGEVNAS
ncbi:MAG: hypothetical protein V4505_02810 [Pseudomonadota bacterium]